MLGQLGVANEIRPPDFGFISRLTADYDIAYDITCQNDTITGMAYHLVNCLIQFGFLN